MNVDDVIAEKIAAAAARDAANKRRRQELNEARQHGLAARHEQKLRHQASQQQKAGRPVNDLTDEEIAGPVGYLANCLAHIRLGHDIAGVETGLVWATAPTQAEVDNARRMVREVSQLLAPN
ncbi:hypothetical protein [Streptomyces diastatochromogenes]|uniref:hypothetical protein n=1 Tax=Streptomyces diastatochromogenes TaxID=42236 RepID=UPI0036AC4E1A